MEKLTRRDFLKIAFPATAAIAACNRTGIPIPQNKSPDPVTPPPAETLKPLIQPKITPQHQEIQPTSMPERIIQSVDFDRGPFYPDFPSSFDVPAETSGGFGRMKIEIDKPLTVRGQILTKYQVAIMKDYANYPAAALIYLTDNPHNPSHLVFYAHSGVNLKKVLPFDFMRRIAIKNPQLILDKKMSITQTLSGQKRVMEFTFIHAAVVSAKGWAESLGYYPEKPEMPQFVRLDKLGIPYFEGDEMLLTFVTCVNDTTKDKEGNNVPEPFSLTSNRLFFTARLTTVSES